ENLQFKETFFFGRTDMANDPELLDLLAAAHLNWVLIGVESLNQKTLDAVNKHQSIEDIRRAGEACREHGIQLIASIVVGADTDTHDDIMRTVQFAKEIDASKLQPAILTPYPGTPVYEGYKKEGRMLWRDERDWENFDMMNATYQPRNMSPWDLQMEFFHAACEFYDRRGALRMGRLFGPAYGLTRYALALIARLGKWGTWLAGLIGKGSWYHYLRHVPWRFADEHRDDEVGRQLRKLRLADDAQEALTTLTILAVMAAPVLLGVRGHGKKALAGD
ncbi:MAG: B12-binding domain-containing radical SAM protein, partial [Parafannyhessea sp.]|uniref:B12-binding domain-containing radical SAM protein n=1 Tax=Parafannyhessea sp. TaxID=2847324 RepID=UPI003F0E6408